MNWFSGNIAEAVKLSKQRNSVFVVFVEGPNESSKELLGLMNSTEISGLLESKECVSIRIHSETESYTQFAEIYKLVPLPSVFFIGTNGIPLSIVTESTKTIAELESKVRSALGLDSETSPKTSASPSNSTESVIAEGSAEESAAASITPQDTAAEAQKKLEFYRAQIEKKRKQKEEEQRRLDKERELERRRVGQELRSFKERQNELDLKQMKEERQRDRLQEQATRKRILDQIAQDRAINKERFANAANVSPPESPPAQDNKPSPQKYDGTEARIQFKKPDGSIEFHVFNATDMFQVVRDYVTNTLLSGKINYTMASSFPRRVFTEADSDKTLVALDLAPTSVILIMSADKALKPKPRPSPPVTAAVGGVLERYNVWGYAQTAFWLIVTPILTLFGYFRGLLGARTHSGSSSDSSGVQKRENEERISDNDAAKRRNLNKLSQQTQPAPSTSGGATGGAYKRPAAASNIHRLRDTQDSDDDTNTWNGNSTQQQ